MTGLEQAKETYRKQWYGAAEKQRADAAIAIAQAEALERIADELARLDRRFSR